MPRYELVEGTSSKFWQIELKGSSFTTTYGKIGTDGTKTLKEWDSPAEAKTEYDKLVAEKVKKGYHPAGDASGPVPVAIVEEKTKKAAAPPPPAKPPAKKAAGARRFQFSEGTSNKFWEIVLEGTNVKTRYGKIGTDGAQTLKEFDDVADAQKEYDKLIHEKTKKGYEET